MISIKKYFFLVLILTLVLCFPVTQSYAQATTLQNPYLLTPTGKYGIGYQDISVTNTTLCPDKFYQNGLNDEDYSADNHSHCHEVMLRVYYPTASSPKLGDHYYAPVLNDFIADLNKHLTLSKNDRVQLKELYQIKTYNTKAAQPSKGKTFPVIFFIPGAGVQAQNYDNIINELVSHGYIVIAMNSVYVAGSIALLNGNMANKYVHYQENVRFAEYSDLQYVFHELQHLDYKKEIRKTIDFKRISFLGHSMGAMNIVYLLQKNADFPHVKAAVYLDPGNVIGKKNYPIFIEHYPAMTIWSSYFRKNMQGSMHLKVDDQEIILSPEIQNVNFSNHINFTDYSTLQYYPFLLTAKIKSYLTKPENVDLGEGDGYLIAMRTNQYVMKYFDARLKRENRGLLK
jgi:acetyl esterase/lipase